MTDSTENAALSASVQDQAIDAALRHIPPVWPLSSFVAVNPFMGQTGETLATAGARLARVAGTRVTMPNAWYMDRITSGEITDADLAAALDASAHAGKPDSVDALKALAREEPTAVTGIQTVADIAAAETRVDWPAVIADRFGTWASGYFDEGQALWAAPRGRSAWAAYRAYATHDLTPEIIGLAGFGQFVADAPEKAADAIARATTTLGLDEAGLESYFHQLLLTFGGWSQYARTQLWQAELAGKDDRTLSDFLAIRLLWEEAMLTLGPASIETRWTEARSAHGNAPAPDSQHIAGEILQEAAERAAQRRLADILAQPAATADEGRPALQAAFCIDVRSEVFRRALESVDPAIRTIGFAGFFGLSAKHRGFASDVEELRLPVLLNPAVTSSSGSESMVDADLSRRYLLRAKRAWGRFKLAAVSSFAFVEAMGPVYVGKLVGDALHLRGQSPANDPAPRFDPPLDLETRIGAAETVLRAMSLTANFARVVVLAGHGANVVNNPHASGLHCGACGGYSGEVNARLLAGLLNDSEVRAGLTEKGIRIPDDTLFLAGLHDTTTDTVTLYTEDRAFPDHAEDVKQAEAWMKTAGAIARGERALRLPRADKADDITVRAKDWAEVRPEWALAGCSAFIAAPRRRTSGRSLAGRAFLHDYEWGPDSENGYGVLELIMTAPVVVASWISLQYYGSTVAPELFGSGNKLLHNVVGGIGVFEGNGGLLRAGLPMQSVHDGENHAHEPLRLSVCIEAPREAMNDILSRHDGVRALFDNRWLHLFAMDGDGRLSHRYTGDLTWEAFEGETDASPETRAAA
ncbi:YbcC family protein [Minwuia sp.]|uniref:YbcC family protein n=1 Tax=Minwuia sp. TaxID=2493630 RepID=UPI003A9110EB